MKKQDTSKTVYKLEIRSLEWDVFWSSTHWVEYRCLPWWEILHHNSKQLFLLVFALLIITIIFFQQLSDFTSGILLLGWTLVRPKPCHVLLKLSCWNLVMLHAHILTMILSSFDSLLQIKFFWFQKWT